MSEALTFKVDASEIAGFLRRLATAPERLRAVLKAANEESSRDVRAKISEQLAGSPTSGKGLRGASFALHYKTRRLQRSWVEKPSVEIPGGWLGGVGSNVEYAAIHEFGGEGRASANVRAHTRQITQAFGRPLKKATTVSVKAFTRSQHWKIPARPYARPSLAARAQAILAIHQLHLGKAVTG